MTKIIITITCAYQDESFLHGICILWFACKYKVNGIRNMKLKKQTKLQLYFWDATINASITFSLMYMRHILTIVWNKIDTTTLDDTK